MTVFLQKNDGIYDYGAAGRSHERTRNTSIDRLAIRVLLDSDMVNGLAFIYAARVAYVEISHQSDYHLFTLSLFFLLCCSLQCVVSVRISEWKIQHFKQLKC